MESKSTPNKANVPDFFKTEPSEEDKLHVKQAYAKYIRDQGKTPQQALNEEMNIKKLLVYLQELDGRWMNIPP